MTTRTTRSVWSALAILAILLVPRAHAAAAGLSAFSGVGSGTGVAAGACDVGLCPDSDSCVCVPISGTGKASAIGAVNFSTVVVVDASESIGNCLEGFGSLSLVSKSKASNTLVLDYVGSICAANPSSGLVLGGAYFIDGSASTGKFANASGSGTIAGSEDDNFVILGNVNGTLLR